jgi:hypothetical protein
MTLACGSCPCAQVSLPFASVTAYVSVFTGSAVNTLTWLAARREDRYPVCGHFLDRECATFVAMPGVTYHIRVASRQGGTFGIVVRAVPTPANDDFVNAEVLVPGIATAGSTEWATSEPGEVNARYSVWYRFSVQDTDPRVARVRFRGTCIHGACVSTLIWRKTSQEGEGGACVLVSSVVMWRCHWACVWPGRYRGRLVLAGTRPIPAWLVDTTLCIVAQGRRHCRPWSW